jgi:putative membrane protein
MWWWHGPGWGWWSVAWIAWMVLFWGGLAAVGFYLLRRRPGGWHPGHTAESVLAERYARGEIDGDEYRERLAVLREGR